MKNLEFDQIKKVDIELISNNISQNGDSIISYYAIEELSELQKEITKQLRNKGNINNLTEEISDVYYVLSMLTQEHNISTEQINEIITSKEIRAREKLSTPQHNTKIQKDDYVEGYECVGPDNTVKKVKGWVEKELPKYITPDGTYKVGYCIQADDEFEGHRGTYIFTSYGPITKLDAKPRIRV